MNEKITQLQLETMSVVKINQSYCENQNKASKVQRRLFGEVKNMEVRDVALQEMTKIIYEKNKKWNFNFLTGEPENGRYVWTKILAENEKENFTPSRSMKRVVKHKSALTPVNNRRKTKDKEVNNQKKITDYMKTKKRNDMWSTKYLETELTERAETYTKYQLHKV